MEEEKTNSEETTVEIENEPSTIGEKKLKKLLNKVDEQKQLLEESDDRIKRLIAEFDNFKKRSNKERSGMYNSVMGDVIISLLPVMDNLEKAANAECSDEQYKSGVEMVLNQFKDVLKANGVTEIKTVGEPFDPSLHEAVSSVEDDSLGTKIIKEEFRKGYMIGDKVLRHSLVVVAN